MKKKLIGYGIATVIGLLIAAMVISIGFSDGTPGKRDIFRILSDAGTLAGLTLMFTSALIAVSDQGAFTGLGYSVRYLRDRLIPGRSSGKPASYADYVQKQAEKREKKNEDVPVRRYPLLSGAVFFLLGIVFLVLFYYG